MYHQALTALNDSAPVWQEVVTSRAAGSPSTTNHFWYSAKSFSPVSDDDGNLTDDGRWAYTWDAENRLIQMETNPAAATVLHPYVKQVFAYDWQGHLIARHVWKGDTPASSTFLSSRRWLYDGWNIVSEFSADSDTSTTLTRVNAYTWGLDLSGTLQGAGGVGGLLSVSTASPSHVYAPSFDGNGNIVAWTRSDQSAPTSRREYDAFGNTLVSEGTAPCSFGFSTKMQDSQTGLYYYGYRFYDPVTGRWLSRDPIEESGGLNLYGFVGNDAIQGIDQLGMFPSDGDASAPSVLMFIRANNRRYKPWGGWNGGRDYYFDIKYLNVDNSVIDGKDSNSNSLIKTYKELIPDICSKSVGEKVHVDHDVNGWFCRARIWTIGHINMKVKGELTKVFNSRTGKCGCKFEGKVAAHRDFFDFDREPREGFGSVEDAGMWAFDKGQVLYSYKFYMVPIGWKEEVKASGECKK